MLKNSREADCNATILSSFLMKRFSGRMQFIIYIFSKSFFLFQRFSEASRLKVGSSSSFSNLDVSKIIS